MKPPTEISEWQLVTMLGGIVFFIYIWSLILWLVKFVRTKKRD